MVLQQNTDNCIFGSAASGTKVSLQFRDKTYSEASDKEGNWKIEFNPGSAGGPFTMEISSSAEAVTYTDVYVGEVWVSSGQSNAQLPMNRLAYKYPDEFNLPLNNNIRMITVPISYALDGEKDTVENPQWIAASPETLAGMSGTAYFFAKKMAAELDVPVGIINASQGGSPITAWMSRESLEELNKTEYVERIEKWSQPGAISSAREKITAAQQKWNTEFFARDKGSSEGWEKLSFEEIKNNPSWKNCSIPGDFDDFGTKAGVLWLKKEITLTEAQAKEFNKKGSRIWFGTIQDADKIWINGEFCGVTYYTYPPRRYPVPANALKAGKNTITVRIQKNGPGEIRLFEEKPYYLFTNDTYVASAVSRNVEKEPLYENENSRKIKLDGTGWKKCQACSMELGPAEMFFEWEPSALYNAMLAPCFNYAVAGAIWYQGESNAGGWAEYKDLLVKMIGLWRQKFVYAKKDMPFVVLQLPNWALGYRDESRQNFGNWPELRYAQQQASEAVENAGLAVLIDGGEWNDLHPEKKKTSGTRAAIEALRLAYGKAYNKAPFVEYCEKIGKKLSLRFNCGSSELKAYQCVEETADFSTESSEVYGFEFILNDGTSVPVTGNLTSTVDVEVALPDKAVDVKELRYLWKNNPWKINLYSKEGLPVRPFKIQL